MDRNPKTGKFIKGNRASVGNRGNIKPKWGNQNAMKHGFHQKIFWLVRNDFLYINTSKSGIIILHPLQFEVYPDGKIVLKDEFVDIEKLKELGVGLQTWTE